MAIKKNWTVKFQDFESADEDVKPWKKVSVIDAIAV